MYSNRILQVAESATLKLNSMVGELKKKGEVILNLTAGEPDFHPPSVAYEEIARALQLHKNKYTAVNGIPELKKAVSDYTNKNQPGLPKLWSEGNVVVSNGAKHALFNAFSVLLNAGDEVLIPAPYWLSYPEMVKISEGVPVIIETDYANGFKMSAQDLKNKITPKTKALILNSPSNPTGIVYSEAELREIGSVIEDYKKQGQIIWVLSDEIYDQLIYGDTEFCSFLKAKPSLQDQTITFNGMSKSFAMTGWRVGWSVAPLEVTKYISNLQGQSTSGVNSLVQWAAFAVLSGDQSHYLNQNRLILEKKRKLILDIFSKCSKIKVCEPDGAFYFFLDVSAGFEKGQDSIGFSEMLLSKKKVAVVPGTPFGAHKFIRISFATDEKTIQTGCEKIVEFLSS